LKLCKVDILREWVFYMSRILANASVDLVQSGAPSTWEVEVNGLAPHNHRRVYQISATTDTLAAQEGIRQFVDEMECLAD
jgi:hypothetical protein